MRYRQPEGPRYTDRNDRTGDDQLRPLAFSGATLRAGWLFGK